MRLTFLRILCAFCLWSAWPNCSLQTNTTTSWNFSYSTAWAAEAHIFNPYMHSTLPSIELSKEATQFAKKLGSRPTTLQDEAKHRKHWRQELYPIVYGKAKAKSEILVFLDYAQVQSEAIWAQVVEATQSISPQQAKVVVFGRSFEHYATELMGLGIWMAYTHPKQALAYFSYTLHRWNVVKNALAKQGIHRKFMHGHDASYGTHLPIAFAFLAKHPGLVPASQEYQLVYKAFNAGNVNMCQTHLAARMYGVKHYPTVVINGKVLSHVTAQNIIQAVH